MNDETRDARLQDYLDGRLERSERERFEARLREDADLAERVRVLREAGRLLREEPVELPPGFHARARARFEETVGRRKSGWRIVVSWEAAGVAVAALVLAGFLLPVVWERGMDPEDLAVATRRPDKGQPAVGKMTEAPIPAEVGDEFAVEGAELEEKAARSVVLEKMDTGRTVDEVELGAAVAKDEPTVFAREAESEPRPSSPPKGPARTREESFAPAPAPPAEAPPTAGTGAKKRAQAAPRGVDEAVASDDADAGSRKEMIEEIRKAVRDEERRAVDDYRQVLAEADARDAESARSDSALAQSEAVPSPPPARTVVVTHVDPVEVTSGPARWAPLPQRSVVAGTTDLVRTEAKWQALLDLYGDDVLSDLEVDFWSERVVLVGQTDPRFDCARVLVVVMDGQATLSLPNADEGDPMNGGCAVVVPRATETVRIDRTEWN